MTKGNPDPKPTDESAAKQAKPAHDIPPFRESGSGASYSPSGNWGAEREGDASPEGAAEQALGEVDGLGITGTPGTTMAGSPTDAGDGGFGPEGGYSKDAAQRAKATGESARGEQKRTK